MTYTTTLQRTRKVNARDEARKRLEGLGWTRRAVDSQLRQIGDLLDHDVEVTEPVEVQHKFKVGDRIQYPPGGCVSPCEPLTIVAIAEHSHARRPIYEYAEGWDFIHSIDPKATLVAPKRVYHLTVEAAHPDIIGWADLLKERINESRETIRGAVSEFIVTDITSEVVE